MTSAT